MGLSLCYRSPTSRNKLLFQSEDITDIDSDNDASGVLKDRNQIKTKFQNEAYEEEDVYYTNEDAESDNPRAVTQQIPKGPPKPLLMRSSKSKSEPLFRRKRGQQSLRARISARNSNRFHNEFVGQKRAASVYVNALEESTTVDLRAAYRDAESLLEKGNDIHEEVKRQSKIIKQANRDIEATEMDICDTSHRLKGMESVGGKLKNIVWRKPARPQGIFIHECDDWSSNSRRCSNPSARHPSYNDKMTNQELIKEGVDRLVHVLDVVEHTQEDISKELGKQEKHLQCLDHNIDHIEHKIHNQTKIMKKVRKK